MAGHPPLAHVPICPLRMHSTWTERRMLHNLSMQEHGTNITTVAFHCLGQPCIALASCARRRALVRMERMSTIHDLSSSLSFPVPPAYWAFLSVGIWLCFVCSKGWHRLDVWDCRQILWGLLSSVCFLSFLQSSPEFQVQCCWALSLFPCPLWPPPVPRAAC
jgi:hypothetical protein